MADQPEAPPSEDGPPRMTEAELREYVDAFLSGRIWDFHHAPDGQDGLMPFMVLRLGGLPEGWDPKNVGTVYEYIDKAGPRSVNGMPTFFSCRIMHTADWEIARATIAREVERRRNMPLEGVKPTT